MNTPNLLRSMLAPAIVVVVAFVTAFFPQRASDDDWWHIKTGIHLWESGEWFPEYDVFSITGPRHEPWVNHEWLSDIILGRLYVHVGIYGCVLLKAAFLALVFFLLYDLAMRRCQHRMIAALAVVMAVLVSQFTMYLRPPVITYGMMVIFLHLLDRMRANPHWGYPTTMVALMIPWINLHGGAILGLVLYGAYAVDAAVRLVLLHRRPWPMQAVNTWVFGGVALGLASLCNPWGYGVHLLTPKVMADPLLIQFISELAPPDLRHAWMFPILALVALIGIVHAGSRVLFGVRARGPMIHLAEAMLVLFLFTQAGKHVRHLPLFAIVAAPVAAVTLRHLFDAMRRFDWKPPSFPVLFFRGLVGLVGGYAFVLGLLLRAVPCMEYSGLVEDAFPIDVCEVILEAELEGPIFHPVNCAGYLIYALSPETMKVYTDSRFDIHGSDPMIEVLLALDQQQPATIGDLRRHQEENQWLLDVLDPPPSSDEVAVWSYILDKHEINLLLAYSDSPLLPQLERHRDTWIRVYARPAQSVLITRQPWAYNLARALWGQEIRWRLAGYALYVRNTPENQQAVQRALRVSRRIQSERVPNPFLQ